MFGLTAYLLMGLLLVTGLAVFVLVRNVAAGKPTGAIQKKIAVGIALMEYVWLALFFGGIFYMLDPSEVLLHAACVLTGGAGVAYPVYLLAKKSAYWVLLPTLFLGIFILLQGGFSILFSRM